MIRLSICIPIYEQDVKALAESLLQQKKDLKEPVELLFFDDGSSGEIRKANSWLAQENTVMYCELPQNIGRSAIRNKLAASAQGTYILFLDGDSIIDNPDFLKKYINHSNENTVLCGGHKYAETPPSTEYSLHFWYGRLKESKSAAERQKQSFQSFHSINFLIPKKIWEEVPFDENLTQYGHEDTLLGYELSQKNIPIVHIGNEVVHNQLETNERFLMKSRQALQNLGKLYLRGNNDFNRSVKMLRVYENMKKMDLHKLFSKLFKMRHTQWEIHLTTSEKPSLYIFNLYKIGYFCWFMRT